MENQEGFKIGDTVKLKSGGPLMTVQTVIGTKEYGITLECCYFHDYKLYIYQLPADAIFGTDE